MNRNSLDFIKSCIATIPDYPKPGILFRDVTSLVEHPQGFAQTIQLLKEYYQEMQIDKIAGTEARGFIFASPLAVALEKGFIPVRKPGKLPRSVLEQSYQLEYGEDCLQMHTDAVKPGEHVLVVDDLLATGGTVEATIKMIRAAGGIVEHAAFVISLPDLGGEARLEAMGVKVLKLVDFPGH